MVCEENVTPVEDSSRRAFGTARVSELASLVALDRECFGALAWGVEAWQDVVVEPGWTTLVWRNGSQPRAAMVLLLEPPVACLASLAVHPSFRGRGIGRDLLREAVQRARQAKARWLTLEVDADNVAAIRLYRNEGFSTLRRFLEDNRSRLEMYRRLGRRGS